MAALLYDADCGFCRWAAAKVLAWDRRGTLRPVALQDRAGSDRLLPGGRPLARAAEAVQPLTSAAYGFVAARRSFLGRFVSAGARRRADERLALRVR